LGIAFLYDPVQLTRLLAAPRGPATLQAEIQAMYGGLELGIGVFFLVAAARSRWVRPALAVQVAVFSGLALGRIVGMVTRDVAGGLFVASLVLELVGALIGLIAFRRAKALMNLNYAHLDRAKQ
jgi:hypothetical protein